MRGVPAVKKYYEGFKADERFNMIAVSLDSDLEMWRKTIQARKMTWANVCDGKGWKTKYAKKYKVKSVPRYILMDAKRRIRLIGGSEKDRTRMTRYLLLELERQEAKGGE